MVSHVKMLTGLFDFIIPVQDLIMQGGRAVWRGSHSSAQFASLLYSSYVYFIFALSFLYSLLSIAY